MSLRRYAQKMSNILGIPHRQEENSMYRCDLQK